MKKLRNKKGFTLVELIIVIVIIAILAAALVTSLLGYVEKAKDDKYYIAARNVETAARTMYSEAYAQDGIKIAGIKWNFTGNAQNTGGGKHFCILEAVFVYKDGAVNGAVTLNKNDSYAKKYYTTMMELVNTKDMCLAGTTYIFFNKQGDVISNSDYKIAGQHATTQLVFKDQKKNALNSVKYDDQNGWTVVK